MILAQITAPHFCAGLELDDGRVTFAAPIISYMQNWTRDRVRDYCGARGWSIRIVNGGGDGNVRTTSPPS